MPRGQEFATVGHLYRSIETGRAHLADRLGEDRLFIGPAFQQADETAFGWPDLQPITDLAGAGRAIERNVEQGGGAGGGRAGGARAAGLPDITPICYTVRGTLARAKSARAVSCVTDAGEADLASTYLPTYRLPTHDP